MKLQDCYLDETMAHILNLEKKAAPALVDRNEVAASNREMIRFEEKKERFIWVPPDKIIFVKSADHYVKTLINCGKQNKWVTRHCTLKELFVLLPSINFVRLNRFYLINRNHFSHINENEKTIYLNNDTSIHVPHSISPYMLNLIKK